MAFTRTQMVAAVAGTLSLAVLTGCPATPTATGTPAPGASASAAPAAGGSTAPAATPAATTAPTTAPSASTAPSAAPSGSGSAGPSTAPSASAPAPSGKVVIVSGNVYDEEGATVDGAQITVKSLDTSVPYTATATTSQGSWVVNNVPEGANVEVVATRGGWTSRRRVGSFQQQATGRRNVVNFGAAGGNAADNSDDTTGESYFISNYPEIVSTEPKTEATGVDNQKLSFKLRLSEPIDEDNRDNLVNALTILPANKEANGDENFGVGGSDLENKAQGTDNSDGTDGFLVSGFQYKIEEGSTFLGKTDRDVTATWNAEGTELTFAFDATLLANDNNECKYQAVLIRSGATADDIIEDEDNNELGTSKSGKLGSYPGDGQIIANAFKEVDLSANNLEISSETGSSNWSSTHDSAANWEIKRDETDPKLTAVDVSKNVDNKHTRIELTFSEGMAAYNGTTAGYSDIKLVDTDPGAGITFGGLADLENNYRFALGDKVGDTEDVNLSDKPVLGETRKLDPRDIDGDAVDAAFGADEELEEDFTFENVAVDTTGAASIDAGAIGTGELFVEVDDSNPNTVLIWIKGRSDYFAGKASEIKAYVEGVADPAGNKISDNDAEKNQVRGTI